MIICSRLCCRLNRQNFARVLANGAAQFSTSATVKTDGDISAQKFIPIYRSSIITVASAFNKIKKMQLLVTGGSLPLSCLFYATNLCDEQVPVVVGTVGIVSTAAVFGVAQLFHHMIGYVYTTPDLKVVKLSYLDFWGRRKDLVLKTDDIKPLSTSKKYPTDYLYHKVHTISSQDEKKLSIRFGEILSTRAFISIFKYDPDANT